MGMWAGQVLTCWSQQTAGSSRSFLPQKTCPVIFTVGKLHGEGDNSADSKKKKFFFKKLKLPPSKQQIKGTDERGGRANIFQKSCAVFGFSQQDLAVCIESSLLLVRNEDTCQRCEAACF